MKNNMTKTFVELWQFIGGRRESVTVEINTETKPVMEGFLAMVEMNMRKRTNKYVAHSRLNRQRAKLLAIATMCLLCTVSCLAQGPSTTKNITVSWTDSVSANVQNYNTYRATTPVAPCPATVTGFVLTGTVASTSTSFLDANLVTGPVYCYVVTAVSTNGVESAVSSIATMDLTRPAPPTGVTAAAK